MSNAPVSDSLPWRTPLDFLPQLAQSGEDYALLYSGLKTNYSGRQSILGVGVAESIEADDFAPLAAKLSTNQTPWQNGWIGYLGYDLKHATETLPRDAASEIDLPALHFVRYRTLLVFDHEAQTLNAYGEPLQLPESAGLPPSPDVADIYSDMDKATYLHHVLALQDAISAGEIYQANLTRKFYGTFAGAPSPEALFANLVHSSPAPYSALIKHGKTAIISSSPECFLHADASGKVTARPIKGSAPRFEDAQADENARCSLAASEKDRAENLMIVDLMRNDLGRSCEVGSVKTEALFDIHSYATVHHMASTVTGQRRADTSPLALVAACFPPGSMTGAPKIRAMELCSELEPRARGVYSGALGYFAGDGAFDLSVVIRTLVLHGRRFEFQVGGAIVHDSTPEGEWQETMVKARGLARAMGLPMTRLEDL